MPCRVHPGKSGVRKKWSEKRETEVHTRRREESTMKTEVKRYIWLNGRGRATVYKGILYLPDSCRRTISMPLR